MPEKCGRSIFDDRYTLLTVFELQTCARKVCPLDCLTTVTHFGHFSHCKNVPKSVPARFFTTVAHFWHFAHCTNVPGKCARSVFDDSYGHCVPWSLGPGLWHWSLVLGPWPWSLTLVPGRTLGLACVAIQASPVWPCRSLLCGHAGSFRVAMQVSLVWPCRPFSPLCGHAGPSSPPCRDGHGAPCGPKVFHWKAKYGNTVYSANRP